jgi:hypothetical protein
MERNNETSEPIMVNRDEMFKNNLKIIGKDRIKTKQKNVKH